MTPRGGQKAPDVSVAIVSETVERYGAAQFPGNRQGNVLAELQAEVAALREEAAFRRGREALLTEQEQRRMQWRAIWISALISGLGVLVTLGGVFVAIWVARR